MTPDNGGYATAAYVLTAVVLLAYVLSIKIRERRLRARLAQLGAQSGQGAAEAR